MDIIMYLGFNYMFCVGDDCHSNSLCQCKLWKWRTMHTCITTNPVQRPALNYNYFVSVTKFFILFYACNKNPANTGTRTAVNMACGTSFPVSRCLFELSTVTTEASLCMVGDLAFIHSVTRFSTVITALLSDYWTQRALRGFTRHTHMKASGQSFVVVHRKERSWLSVQLIQHSDVKSLKSDLWSLIPELTHTVTLGQATDLLCNNFLQSNSWLHKQD